jgi:hypothetical protein
MAGFETIFVFSINNMFSVGLFYAFFIREALLMNPEVDKSVSDFGWSKRVVRMLGVFGEMWTMMIAMFCILPRICFWKRHVGENFLVRRCACCVGIGRLGNKIST